MNFKELLLSMNIPLKGFMIIGFLCSMIFAVPAFCAGHTIKGTISGYEGKGAMLAMMYGGNQYMVDSAAVVNGSFTFKSMYDLQSGVYLVVLPPSKSFLILVDQNIPSINFKADVNDIEGTISFDKSPDNTEYYNYLKFFQTKKIDLDRIKTDYDSQKSEDAKTELMAKMQHMKKEIVQYQTELVARIPGTLTAAMVKCELPVEPPAFEGSPEDMQLKKFFFQKTHYFDNIDLNDERLIRAPKNVLVERVHYFLDNLTVQQPDSINKSVDYILAKTAKTQVAYRFLFTDMFNKYREAKKVGMDAIFVHLAEDYIAKGKTPWIEEEEKTKVLTAVKAISPTLIGKKAPDFTVQKRDGKNISLNDIKSQYTILIFWSPNCAHCQKDMPALTNFYNAYKDKGVEIFAVCTKVNEEEKNCWDFLDKNKLTNWINGSDQKGGSSAVQVTYNVKTTPKIYVLGADKTILAKDIGVENLEEVMKRLLKS
ncbi:MAG: redoxin domain-containing protein [Saprospiraceae bacterium]